MTTVVHYKYPDDPWDSMVLMFGAEFMATHKGRETVLSDLEGNVLSRIPISDDEVVCDACNAGIGPGDPIGLNAWGLRCWDCVKRLLDSCDSTRVEVYTERSGS